MSNNIALDLGTSNTRIFTSAKGKVLDEPSVVSYDADTRDIIAVGTEAYNMIGRTPGRICAEYPLTSGVISDFGLVEDLVSALLHKLNTSKLLMPKVVACVPGEITDVEKRAVVNAISSIGVRKVYLIEAAKAAAIGAGLTITDSHGVMIADIGGGTADIAVISLGGIASSCSVKRAGNYMDEEIVKYIRKKYFLYIGTRTAELAKMTIGCVCPPEEEKTFVMKGRDAVSGLPRSIEVTSSEIMEAIFETALNIVKSISKVMEETPPELVGDIHTDGITISGGLSKLTGFPELIERVMKIKVNIPENPSDCVINGCGKSIPYINAADDINSTIINPLVEAY
ncbi:MAG: rod shape-determining protein [Bacillota bacterium]|nr:rod shape-determining protein [Bacillota bacterium]